VVTCLSAVACSAATIYHTGFEVAEGYNVNLDLVGQQGWTSAGSGGNGLINGFFAGQGQQAYLGFNQASASGLWVYQPLDESLSQAQFSVTMAVTDSSNRHWDDFHWEVYNTKGNRLFLIDFYNSDLRVYYALDGTNDYTWSGLTFTNSVTYSLAVMIDFAANRWSATLNGATVATNQLITTVGAPLNLGDIDAAWILSDTNNPGDNYMVFDNYAVSGTVPAPQMRLVSFLGRAPIVRLSGLDDAQFAVEGSTNLVNWVGLTTNTTVGGFFDYTDAGAIGLSTRFYRGRWVP
jgi:hypothetical protein